MQTGTGNRLLIPTPSPTGHQPAGRGVRELPSALKGGHFEYTPFIRSDEDENYTEISRVFAGESELVRRPVMTPGTFTIFRGHRSLHRVTPVGHTTPARLIVLFGYDQNPGMIYPESTVNDFRNPSSDLYYGGPA